jgi:hypothetical protein
MLGTTSKEKEKETATRASVSNAMTKETIPSIAIANNIPTSLTTIEPLEKSKNNWTMRK